MKLHDPLNALLLKYSLCAALCAFSCRVDAQLIYTDLSYPNRVAIDQTGNLYVTDNSSVVRKITSSGVVSILAGDTYGYSDGTGSAARFAAPNVGAVDSSGNAYVADHDNYSIRKITSSGVVTTLAGDRLTPGHTDGSGNAALFYFPKDVAVDREGNVYVADTDNNTIRKITNTGVVTTLAGLARSEGSTDGTGGTARFSYPDGIAVDSSGNVYVADTYNSTIRKITNAGVVTTLAGLANLSSGAVDGTGSAARFARPSDVAVDSSGNVYVADTNNHTIRKITNAGVVTTLAGLAGVSGSTDGTGSAARFYTPNGVAVDAGGTVYVADSGNNSIRKITSGGVVTTFSKTPTPPAAPTEVSAVSGNNQAVVTFTAPVSNGGANITSYTVLAKPVDGGSTVTVTGSGSPITVRGLANGKSYTFTVIAINVFGSSSASIASSILLVDIKYIFSDSKAGWVNHAYLAVDVAGNLYHAGFEDHIIRKLKIGGIVNGSWQPQWAQYLAGKLNVTGSNDGTGFDARFNEPKGIAVDQAGSVYVADQANETIRKVSGVSVTGTRYITGTVEASMSGDPRAIVTTLAGKAGIRGSDNGTGSTALFNYPQNVAVDEMGNVYASEQDGLTIRKITAAGVVTTLAGRAGVSGAVDGTGSAARFNVPTGIAVDPSGNVYVADTANHTIRKITNAGVVTTLAGLAGVSGSIDGTGSAARFYDPRGLALDAAGNIYVADHSNKIIRIISQTGVVKTLRDLADNVLLFNYPTSVAVDSAKVIHVAAGGYILTSLSAANFRYVQNKAPTTIQITPETGDLSYQWLKDGVVISGAHDLSYKISSVVATDNGYYSVKITNKDYVATTSSLWLVVVGLPENLIISPAAVTTTIGSVVTFSVGLATLATYGTVTFQWKKDGGDIAGATGAIYTISAVTPTSIGSYTVVVTNEAGSTTSAPATLTVNVLPAITTQPSSQSVTVGSSVTFSVVATGTPTPTYQWRKDGAAISGATSASYALSLPVSGDAGSYTVVVTNAAGSVTSSSATLTVNAAPAPAPTPAPSSSGGGGGGAVSPWFIGALGFLLLVRRTRRRE